MAGRSKSDSACAYGIGGEHARVRGRRGAVDVEEQQPIEPRRDRIAFGVTSQ